MDWKKIFANHESNNGLTFRRYKELTHSLAKQQQQQIIIIIIIHLENGERIKSFAKEDYKWPIGIHQKIFSIDNHQGNGN